MDKKPLHLVLKGIYYDRIEKGIKKVEYRRKTDYWTKRIIKKDPDIVVFHRGYTKQIMTFHIRNIIVFSYQFAILLGKRIN